MAKTYGKRGRVIRSQCEVYLNTSVNNNAIKLIFPFFEGPRFSEFYGVYKKGIEAGKIMNFSTPLKRDFMGKITFYSMIYV